MPKVYDIIIIGGGAVGLASFHAGRCATPSDLNALSSQMIGNSQGWENMAAGACSCD